MTWQQVRHPRRLIVGRLYPGSFVLGNTYARGAGWPVVAEWPVRRCCAGTRIARRRQATRSPIPLVCIALVAEINGGLAPPRDTAPPPIMAGLIASAGFDPLVAG